MKLIKSFCPRPSAEVDAELRLSAMCNSLDDCLDAGTTATAECEAEDQGVGRRAIRVREKKGALARRVWVERWRTGTANLRLFGACSDSTSATRHRALG